MSIPRGDETLIEGVTIAEILEFYNLIYTFFVRMRSNKSCPKKLRSALDKPLWATEEVLYVALYGYTKRALFSKRGSYYKNLKLEPTLDGRVKKILGTLFVAFYYDMQAKKVIGEEIKEELEQQSQAAAASAQQVVNSISYDLRTTSIEEQERMQQYIDDFDLHSGIDLDILRNLVRTQILIERTHLDMLNGKSVNVDLKSLSDQLKNYTMLLGLSKKDRVDLGSERAKGSIAELSTVYEQTIREAPQLEYEFLLEELEMLLNKYDRRTIYGDRELTEKEFMVLSGGFTVQEARELLGSDKQNE